MQRSFLNKTHLIILLAAVLGTVGCSKKEYAVPTSKDVLQNDVIKRSLGPNIVGQPIEFVYAMAILPDKGKIVSAQVEASIAGGAGTLLENRSFSTSGSGADVPVTVGTPAVNSGPTTTVTFNKDTSAAALRYFYVVPEEARGKTVSFTFKATSSNGETVSYKMGPYNVSKMDMVRNLTVKNNDSAYISISNLAVYTAAGAAANADKIDLVYLYRNITTSAFNHALVSPAADPQYLPGVTLPPGVNKTAKIIKVFNLPDYDLARTQVGVYIDDLDFQKIDLSGAPNYSINLRAEAGTWVETADGKYRAYIFLNSVNTAAGGSAVISIKRYAL
ncbi:MAG TPA: DUF4466 family protein [Flavitalea sp.]|nr:DUF4466 family protein [Flavitalea sp.]